MSGFKGVWAALAAVLAVTAAFAQDRPPVLAPDFSGRQPRVARDLSGSGLHVALPAAAVRCDGPFGKALVFDGKSKLAMPEDNRLVMKSSLTLDVWMRVDALGEVGCLVDRSGEVYRLAVNADGSLHYGLKSANGRADLTAGKVAPGEWRRITATFQRPAMTLYVDGKKVAARDFDDAVSAGGTLWLGCRSGRMEFFRGAVAVFRLYDYARPPAEGDEKLGFGPAQAIQEAKATMKESQGLISADTGVMQFVLDARTGGLRGLTVGGKRLVNDNATPPLSATLMESETYDGIVDHAPRRMIPATYRFDGLKAASSAQGVSASGRGALEFPGGDALDFQIEWKAAAGSRRLQAAVSFAKRGEFRNRFLRDLAVVQPLSLNLRKRVVQAADQGLRWDTRHLYHFHMHVDFLDPPDTNWWRFFYVDQESDHSYSIWRAENDDTSGLYAFRGRRAPGWVTVYDQQGGALLAYRKLSERAPKCLWVDALRGAKAGLYLHSPTQPAADLADPRLQAGLFGAPHELDFIFFEGAEAIEQPEAELAAAWGDESVAGDGMVRHTPVDDEVRRWDAAAAVGDAVPLVSGGIPLPKAAIERPDQARLFVAGKETPVQAEAIAYWPDRSIKWLLLVFPLDGQGGYGFIPGAGEGDEVAFRVTLRQGEPVPATLRFGKGVKAGVARSPLQVQAGADDVRINTGPLALRLAKGETWLASAALNGREMLRQDGRPQAFVDFLRLKDGYPTGTTHPEGVSDPGPVQIEKIEVEQAGPLRAVVRLEGKAAAQEPPRVIMRLEAYAGRPFARLTHTVEFLHKDPRVAFVRSMGLRLALDLDPASAKLAAGGQDGPVPLAAAPATGLRQFSHLNYEVWQTETGRRHRTVRESKHRSRGWLGVQDARGGLAVVERCMWQEFPKELLARLDQPALEVGLWPASAPPMDVRRYSSYPHQGQGESAPADVRWVLDHYYKNDPFVGVTKTHEMLLCFLGPQADPGRIDTLASDFQSQPLVYAGWEWYARTRAVIPYVDPADERFARFNATLHNVADWWLFHQRSWGWWGMWDFGDVRHLFRSGYGRIYPPDDLSKLLAMPKAERTREKVASFRQIQDYFPQNDWAADNGRWGWGNTEGLPGLFMSMEYLRTGRRDLFFFVEANARHSRDVDARHAGMWFGAGTRHGVQHWSDGNHEERQTTFTEQRFHYLLTGEPRTCEWNRDLSERHYLKGQLKTHAAHSGRSYGLLTRWEITGDPALGETLRNYMHAFAQPEGVAIEPVVAFPEGQLKGKAEGLHDGNMFFHSFGAGHALLEYWYLTGDEQVRQAMLKTAEVAFQKDPGGLLRKVVAFAARHADDGSRFRQAMAAWAAQRGHRHVFQQVTANRAHWTGETAVLVGSVPGAWFWLNDAGYFASALEREPEVTKEIEASIRPIEERPAAAVPRTPRGSWQSEYDRPEFAEYFKERLRDWK